MVDEPDRFRDERPSAFPSGRDESALQRADRNLSELLQELRVALPGVQVLFAFLLTVPFSARFNELTLFQERLYFGILLGAALSTALFIAPTAGHRILFHMQQKEYLVRIANRFALAGLAVLAVSMCGVILLISDILFAPAACIVTTTLAALVFAGLWYVGPLLRRRERMRAGADFD
jgi:hypothetical protein